jgi:ABC-type nitrate/sulfonate/bicarbonate transport system substrate-binding protein
MIKTRLHLGHVGLLDAAPLLVAREQGFFADEGFDVVLSCELGLATLCGKLADQRMDGACLPAPLAVLLSLGSGVPRVAMRVAGVTCWQGMGVVLAGERATTAAPRIGVVAPGTPTRLLLHKLAQAPDGPLSAEATQVPMAASQLVDFLREGMLDGFCGIDPLPALARLLAGALSVADSGTLFPGHPGAVIALRADRTDARPDLLPALGRALARGREFCADPARREAVWRLLLSQAPYAELDAAARDALVAHVVSGKPGWTSMRFEVATERTGLSPAAESCLENACRGAVAPAARNLDFKAEITRMFPRREPALAAR